MIAAAWFAHERVNQRIHGAAQPPVFTTKMSPGR
jgi:hypothetical protein